MPSKVERQDLIDDVLSVHAQHPDDFKIETYLKYGKYSKAPIRREFGGWNNMLEALGIEINMHKNVSKEDVIHDMIRLYKEFGKLNSNIQRKHSRYSQIVIDNLFGSFTEMMSEIGLSSGYEKNISKDKLLAELRRLHREYGYVNQTIIAKFSMYSVPTFYNKFGNMSNMYDALGVRNDPNEGDYFNKASYVIGIVADYLDENPIPEWTCKWLVNPETNNNLFVDGYFPDHTLAVEFDGEQHFRYIPFLHGHDVDKFKRQQELDRLKDQLLMSHDIKVLRIRYDEDLSIEHIRSKVDQVVTNRH